MLNIIIGLILAFTFIYIFLPRDPRHYACTPFYADYESREACLQAYDEARQARDPADQLSSSLYPPPQ